MVLAKFRIDRHLPIKEANNMRIESTIIVIRFAESEPLKNRMNDVNRILKDDFGRDEEFSISRINGGDRPALICFIEMAAEEIRKFITSTKSLNAMSIAVTTKYRFD